jgi:DNA polymerase-1
VRTSRTSAEDPNVQNWPKYGDGKQLRKQVVARKGHTLVAVDYSGIQARNVAMESGDATLVQSYFDHYDIHTDWMKRIKAYWPRFGDIDDPKKKSELRHKAKNKLVFPLFFGSQATSVARDLGMDASIGYRLYDDFWNMFPDVRKWHKRLHRFYRQNGYVAGHSRFRRYGPINENMQINSPIQADEAFIVLSAMIRLAAHEDENMQPIMEIHDDLTFEIETTKLDDYIPAIIEEMLQIEHDWINVPLGLEVSTGTNWLDMKEIGKFEATREKGWYEL